MHQCGARALLLALVPVQALLLVQAPPPALTPVLQLLRLVRLGYLREAREEATAVQTLLPLVVLARDQTRAS